MGLVADFKEGQDIQKQAFEQLLNLTEEHQREQLVNRPTRGKNILDLIFSNKPHLFEDCSTTIIRPNSDHDLVNITMTNPTSVRSGKSLERFALPKPCYSKFPLLLLHTYSAYILHLL